MEVYTQKLDFSGFFRKKAQSDAVNSSTARSNVKLTKNANTFEIGSQT